MKIQNEIKQEILNSKYTAIVCHQSPDGDTLGSAFALCEVLNRSGRKVDVICTDLLPYKYSFMNEIPIINTFNSTKYDLVVFVDCATIKLSGNLFEKENLKALNTINIDHHGTNSQYAKLNYVDDSFSSTAEIILELIKSFSADIDKKIAEYIYVGVLTDTGGFAHSYTSARTHENAAFLLRCGVDFSKLHKDLFGTIPFSKLMLTKQMLLNLKILENGKVAFAMLNFEDFEESGATQQDSESLINMLLSAENIKIAVLIRQIEKNLFKASFRSVDEVNISKAANILGGGGHKQASGATLQCEKTEVTDVIIDAIHKAELLK